MNDKPGRSALPLGGMLICAVVLIAGLLVIVGFEGGWSISPGKPAVDPASVPTQDAHAQLTDAARQTGFPVHVPTVPKIWHSNSGDVVPIAGANAVRTGWITDGDGFIRLIQSDAPVGAIAANSAEQPTPPPAQGSVQAGGVSWTVYPAVRAEKTWIWDAGSYRVGITGSAGDARFRIMAEAVHSAPIAKPR